MRKSLPFDLLLSMVLPACGSVAPSQVQDADAVTTDAAPAPLDAAQGIVHWCSPGDACPAGNVCREYKSGYACQQGQYACSATSGCPTGSTCCWVPWAVETTSCVAIGACQDVPPYGAWTACATDADCAGAGPDVHCYEPTATRPGTCTP